MPKHVTIVADPGSTHLGKKEYGFELVRVAKETGCSAIKFQLFEGEPYKSNGNIELPFDLFKEFYMYGKEIGMPVTASVFNAKAYEFLLTLPDVHHIKFAYSQRKSPIIKAAVGIGKRVVVTSNVFDDTCPGAIRLYTQLMNGEPQYPATALNNYEGLFPERFQGLSDHSLGFLEAVKARDNGAVWIEKHIKLSYSDCEDVPDGKFALKPDELQKFCWKVQP